MYRIFLTIVFVLFNVMLIAQPEQLGRYELEKKNTDAYFNVVSLGEKGLVILRDTDEYRRNEGNVWNVIAVDTALEEKWNIEMFVDNKHVFKGYEVKNDAVYMIFSADENAISDYHLMVINTDDGKVSEYDIKNEIAIDLSHLIVLNKHLILSGYVRYSPTVVSYKLGDKSLEVIPGFFKDKSSILDLRANTNGTFNILTLEKNFRVQQMKLRTYAPQGDILFEKLIDVDSEHKALNGKITGFVNGNVAVTGTYGVSASYSQGIYFTIVKPEGQKDISRYINYGELEHFFDHMGEKRAAKMKRKAEDRMAKGNEFKYGAKVFVHEVQEHSNGYLIAAEIYDPEYNKMGNREMYSPYAYGLGRFNDYRYRPTARQDYVKRPGNLPSVKEADHFRYMQSVLIKLDRRGQLMWDNSIEIEDVETFSLEQVTDYNFTGKAKDMFNMLYKSKDEVHYKTIDRAEVLIEGDQVIKLNADNEEIKYTYEGVGTARHWYENNFFVWGFHKVQNQDEDGRRSVLFINKVAF